MNELQSLVERLRADAAPVRLIAEQSGVPYGTLRKVLSGKTPNPRIGTVELLRAYCDRATQ